MEVKQDKSSEEIVIYFEWCRYPKLGRARHQVCTFLRTIPKSNYLLCYKDPSSDNCFHLISNEDRLILNCLGIKLKAYDKLCQGL